MPQYTGVYVVRQLISGVTTAKTLLQIKAGATFPLHLIRASITNASVETSDTLHAQVLRKTGTATVTSFTPLLVNPTYPVAKAVGGTAATGHTATVEGTDGDVLDEEGVNVLNGYRQLWLPEERPVVAAAGFIALKSAITVTSVDLVAVMVFGELG